MRKFLLLFSLLLFCQFSYSQNYQGYVPFPTSNAGWNDYYDCSFNSYEIVGDTVINSVVYHQLYVNGIFYHSNWQGCSPQNGYTPFSHYAGAFRNDSLNKKVFFVPPNAGTDTLLYDFDLSVGDTIAPNYRNNPNMFDTVYVVRVDTVFLGNIWRKRFTLNDCGIMLNDTVRLIEGIGSTQSLLGWTNTCPFEFGAALECMTINGKTIYPDSTYSCNLITGLASHESKDLKKVLLFPNPSSGLVHIKSPEEYASVKIFDLQGRLVKTINPMADYFELPQNKGLYYIKLENQKGEVYTEKIIRQ